MRTPHRTGGFTLIEIMIVILILGLIVAIAIPNFLKTRTIAQRNICIENLAQIQSAKQLWGLENGKKNGAAVTADDLFGPNLYIRKKPTCPATGEDYSYGVIGDTPQCATEGHTL
jgi:prepilin-type N-terminal cleavage/methylation domain-containing protein